MEKGVSLRQFLFAVPFVAPFLWLLTHMEFHWKISLSEIRIHFLQSLLQGSLSLGLISIFGICFCMGLIGIKSSRLRNIIMGLSVLPAFAPSLFVVVSFQMWFDLLNLYHFENLLTVVVVHSMINAGLAGTLFYFLLEANMQRQAELAYTEGGSPMRSMFHLLLAQKKSLGIILISFFGLCFTSFAIPLILGGSSGATLEILAFQRLSEKGDLFGAFTVMALQWIAFFTLYWLFGRGFTGGYFSQGALPPWYGKKSFLMFGFFAAAISLGGMFVGLGSGWTQFLDLVQSDFSVFSLWVSSLGLAVLSGFIASLLYLFVAYSWVDRSLHNFIGAFGSVSSVLLGLSLFVLPISIYLKLGLGLCILFFPLAYRLFGAPALTTITEQVRVAELMGASRAYRFQKIVFPQVMPAAIKLFGVVGFWSIGDFAFSSVVTGEIFNLGLLSKSLMQSYRLELAALLSWVILLTGGLLFMLSIWGADVCRRKLIL